MPIRSTSSLVAMQREKDRLAQWRRDRSMRRKAHQMDTLGSLVSPSAGTSTDAVAVSSLSTQTIVNTSWDEVARSSPQFDSYAAEDAMDHRSLVATRDAQMRRRITKNLVKHHHERVRHAVAYHDERAEGELRKLQKEAEAARCLMSSRQLKNRKGVSPTDQDHHLTERSEDEFSLSQQRGRPASQEGYELPPLIVRQRTPKPQVASLSPELKEILDRNRRAATPPFATQTHPDEWTTLPCRLRSPTESTPALRRLIDDSCTNVEAETATALANAHDVRRRRRARELLSRQFSRLLLNGGQPSVQPASGGLLETSRNSETGSSAALLVTMRTSPPRRARAASEQNTAVVIAARVPTTAQIATADAAIRKSRAANAPSHIAFSYWDTVNAIPQLHSRR
jgi:hypothetical protein